MGVTLNKNSTTTEPPPNAVADFLFISLASFNWLFVRSVIYSHDFHEMHAHLRGPKTF